ncbi:outer membrane protein transport protein [Ferrimonas kyonanensis]|uniref:outer membrane protein transport protein n=1 Tax=Ferrimonas kyonanensis TaxID=364763 RepID=UPI000414CC12|nr:outer membrane protein transport protein [Ferrimonas kyonanensis]
MKIRVVAAVVATVLAAQAQGAGFQLAEYSATGLGRAFAGEAAIADNASAQGRNPALLMQLDGQQLSLGAIYVDPNIDSQGDVSVSLNGTPVYATGPGEADADDFAPAALVPNFYYSNRLSDQWAIGVALNSSYGLATEVPAGHATAIFGSTTEVTTIEFAPSLAYKASDALSFGVALRALYGDGKVEATVPAWAEGLGVLPSGSTGAVLKSVEGDGVAFGYRLGATWEPAAGHRIGLAYHSEIEVELEGDATGAGFGLAPGASKPGSLKLPLPAYAEFATFHQLTERFAMHGSINWTDWSAFEALVVEFPGEPNNLLKEENFKDNWRFALGGTYEASDIWTLRAGMAYDKTAVGDADRTLTIPDSDRLWFSIGSAWQLQKDLTLDLALTYIEATGDAPVNETMVMPISGMGNAEISYSGGIEGNVVLVGAQLSYVF